MDKKTFAKTTTQVLRDYGFVNSGSCHFYLNLERVVVRVEKISAPRNEGAKAFVFGCCFKDIHPDLDFSNMNINDYKDLPWDMYPCKYVKSPELLYFNGNPYHKWAFYPEDYDQETWTAIFTGMLHKVFDPFKTDFENYVRNNFSPENTGMCADAYDEFKRRGLIF